MSRLKKLEFSITSLSPQGLDYLRAGFCIGENPNHLRASKYTILDRIYNSGEGPELDDIPVEVWNTLGLSPEDRAEIEVLWADNPDNEVEWVR